MHADRQEARIGQELSEKFKLIPNFAKDGGPCTALTAARAPAGDRGFGTAPSENLLFAEATRLSSDASKAAWAAGQPPGSLVERRPVLENWRATFEAFMRPVGRQARDCKP